jgi:phage I-like protein
VEQNEDLCRALQYALNCPKTWSLADMIAELNRVGDKRSTGLAAASAGRTLLETLGGHGDAIAALRAAPPDPALFVPVAVLHEKQAELAALRSSTSRGEAAGLLEAALAAGKIATPAKRGYANLLAGLDADGNPLAAASANLAALRAYLDSEDPNPALLNTQTHGKAPPDEDAGPTALEVAACRSMGLSLEQYRAGADNLKNRHAGT